MKIAIVASDYLPTIGGVQTAVRHIALNATRRGHQVIILSSLPPGNVPRIERIDATMVYRFPWGRRPLWSLAIRALQTLGGMARVLRDFKPDVVYVHFLTINALYTLLLHYALRFTLIVSARGNDIQGIPQRSRLQRWMLVQLYRRADAALFCSTYVQRDAAPYLKNISPHAYVGVVGDGFDPDEFRSPRTYENSSPYILAMGRLVHKKGFDLLIRAFAQIAPEFPRVQLLIAGDGEERHALENLIDELKMRGRVVLLGFCDRATSLALFWGCEFFVLSSRLEPFGIVVAEAMAAHKAVLATRSGGVIDLMRPGENGLLVEPASDALANGMRQLLAHPAETRAMGERAAQSIQPHTWAAITDDLLKVLENVRSARLNARHPH
jgi:glycosyltransferase involved in cell wall biosynthesis